MGNDPLSFPPQVVEEIVIILPIREPKNKEATNKKKKFSEFNIIEILKAVEAGLPIAETLRHCVLAQSTCCK